MAESIQSGEHLMAYRSRWRSGVGARCKADLLCGIDAVEIILRGEIPACKIALHPSATIRHLTAFVCKILSIIEACDILGTVPEIRS